MDYVKKTLFFLLAPFYIILHLILAHTYGTTDNSRPGWYQELWDEGFGSKVIFILLAPIIFPFVYFMYFTHEWWEELND